jgi:hypothetical protein
MKKFTTLCICMSLMFVFSCQTESIEKDNLKLNNDNNTTDDSCETFFAIGGADQSTCFLDSGFNRWGWTIGPLTDGTYTFDMYSGAGQCDTDKGTLVGSLNVNYNEVLETVDVDYTMLEGFIINETHLYVGYEPYPLGQNGNFTVAPGQFPYQNQLDNATSDSYPLTGITGEIYIIAHGVVCDDDDDDNGGGPF